MRISFELSLPGTLIQLFCFNMKLSFSFVFLYIIAFYLLGNMCVSYSLHQ